MRVRKSATGSVKLIVSPSSPVRSALYGEPAGMSLAPYRIRAQYLGDGNCPPLQLNRTTRTTSSRLEYHRAAPTAGSTDGRCRTCADRHADVRIDGSGYAGATKTWVYGRPSPSSL